MRQAKKSLAPFLRKTVHATCAARGIGSRVERRRLNDYAVAKIANIPAMVAKDAVVAPEAT